MRPKLTLQETIDELCDLYRTLIRALNPTSGISDDTQTSHAKPGSRPALNLAASTQRSEIDLTAEDIALRARDQLGFQHHKPRTLTRMHRGWLMNSRVCTFTQVEIVDYATIATLRALPALLEAIPPMLSARFCQDLEQLRRDTRITLGLDPPPARLDVNCPECFGLQRIPLKLYTLLADTIEARVWCPNPICGYSCENPACWCAVPGSRRHRMVWTTSDLLRLGRLLETA